MAKSVTIIILVVAIGLIIFFHVKEIQLNNRNEAKWAEGEKAKAVEIENARQDSNLTENPKPAAQV